MSVHSGSLSDELVNVDDAEAREIASGIFDLDGSVVRFATEKDDTFRVDVRDGSRFILKIAHPGESADELSFQTGLLQHVAAEAPDLPVPRSFPDRQGCHIPSVTTRGGDVRRARLLSFMPGQPLSRTGASPEGRQKIGALLAALRFATAGFSHPADSRPLAWNVQNFVALEPLIRHVDNPWHRTQLNLALRRFEVIEPVLGSLRRQVLHNDFNTDNIVVDPDSQNFVTGIIDFGDAVRTAVAIDVSTAMMNQFPRTPQSPSSDIFADAYDVLRGYLEVADLTAEELALIPHLAMARVATRALLTTWRARLFPQNSAYILRNTEPGWGQLDWFMSRTPDQISRLLQSFAA